MAATNDRLEPAPTATAAAEGWRFNWLAAVGLGLILTVAAAVLVQGRQFSMLRVAVQDTDAHVAMQVLQAEGDLLRLSRQWVASADDTRPAATAALRANYGAWVRSMERLRSDDAQRLFEGHSEQLQALRDLERFTAQAAAAMGAQSSAVRDAGVLHGLQAQLNAMEAPMRQLSLHAARTVSQGAEARHDMVRKQARLGLGVTLFLSFLTLAFAGVAMHHLKQLRERRLALEELAEKLKQARREAEAASDAKSAFLANMSHEIRTPFHGLMGMLSLLRETGLTARQVDYLRTATESADHLLALLNDILDMSQLEAGRMSLAPAPSDLRALLRDVEALMRPQANAKSLSLHFDAAPGVPERVMLDSTRVKQILFNLLSNAIKFSDHGTVVLDVQVRQASAGKADAAPAAASTADANAPGQWLQFVVSDTGVGMDATMLERLFRRFSQGDSSPQRRHGGTGLGLEISRNLARLMHGDITVHSKAGQGSNFTFDMPLMPLPDASLHTTQPRSLGDDAHRPLRVLVAEDHPVNRQYLAALLDNLGHHGHFTANGQEAVKAASEQPFDVVLMDLHMPVLDGLGATKAIRALPDRSAATVPIVALTADAFEQTRDRCLVAGMNDFLTKPVSPQKLASSLRRLFGAAAGVPAHPRSDKPLQLPAAAEGQPLIDTAALQMALQAMSPERLSQLIEAFLEQGPQTVQRLRAAVRDAQPLALRVNAHAAKGAALNLGLSALAATASALHEGAAHLPAHEVARLVQRYEELLPLTRRAVQAAGLMSDTSEPV